MIPLTQKMLIDVLDENGLRTGETLSKAEIHATGKLHRAVHLYLFDTSGRILLQRRSQTVDHYPGVWSISLTGHVDAGEGSTTAVLRELKEELGLEPDEITIEHVFSYRRDARLNPEHTDRQLHEVFVGFCKNDECDISFNPQEVSEVKFVPFSEVKRMLTDTESDLASVYREACADLVYYMSSRLRALQL